MGSSFLAKKPKAQNPKNPKPKPKPKLKNIALKQKGIMARYYHLRFDIWICLALGFLAGCGVEALAKSVRTASYEDYKADHVVASGEIGGPATAETFRAESIKDLETHDTFTVISPGIEYRNRGSGYYNGMPLHALTLPSGEIIAARINTENVTKVNESDSYYTGDTILPIGQLVEANLEDSETFLSQIEYKEPLSRHDIYIDMVGAGAIESPEYYIDDFALGLQILTTVAVFAILHFIGSKIGLFPAFFTKKQHAPKSDWE